MTDLILHTYDLSPFGQKVRLALGYKRLTWNVVDVAVWPPRPGLEPLTAGYRRIPVLQIGADLFCDTALILRELERRHPQPTLYPDGTAGLATALSAWTETSLFMPLAAMATAVIGDSIPDDFIADRIAFMRHDFRREPSLRALPENRQRVAAAMTVLGDLLADGRDFLLGNQLSAADLAAFHVLQFGKQHGGAEIEGMLPYGPLLAWMARVAAIGHGDPHPMSPDDALAIARDAAPAPTEGVATGDPCGLAAGTSVIVHTGDPGPPIAGTLVAANRDRVTISHGNDAAGTVHVHFPRIGYVVLPA